jgi:Gpi18-like mannosyltransferase
MISLKKVLVYILVWRLFLLVSVLIGIQTLSLQTSFLGGGLSSYLSNPYIYPFINFDGEHYLSLVQKGYEQYTYFYFPGYPIVVRIMSDLLGNTFYSQSVAGIIISFISFVFAVIGLKKLLVLDKLTNIFSSVLLVLLLFPTSYYFASYYTESLFLALSVWSFYFARNKNWLIAGLFGLFATATRITGIALLPALIVEWYISKENMKLSTIIGMLLIPLGLVFYMLYLQITTSDALVFMRSLGDVFGEQRAGAFVLFPQVFYRYIVKILPNITWGYLPNVYTTILEFVVASLFLFLIWISYQKQRLSYFVYVASMYVISTVSGSFSSLPRYVLVMFPIFFLMAHYLDSLSPKLKYGVCTILLVLLGITTALFSRGYWIS